MTERETLLLGVLLHDIGKFWQRTEPQKRISHQEWGRRFCEEILPAKWKDIEPILTKHHESGIYDKLVILAQKADRLSASERQKREGIKGDIRIDRLASILGKVSLEKNQKEKLGFGYRLMHLSLDEKCFPFRSVDENTTLIHEYRELWNSFVNEFVELPEETFQTYFESLYFLLQKYTWCIPSATYYSEPDISLFDHAKTTAAIAACLWETDEKDNFLFLEGDLSGIQDFLYTGANPQEAQKGMAKRLRGRSFYLTLLNESLGYGLLMELELPIVNMLWCGGGHYAILAPNIKIVNEKIKKFEERINNWLIEEFQGELAFNLGVVECSGNDLKTFATVLSQMRQVMSNKKKRKFSSLRNLPIFPLKKEVCPVCGCDTDNKGICDNCRTMERLGELLPKVQSLSLVKEVLPESENVFPFRQLGLTWVLGTSHSGKPGIDFSFTSESFLHPGRRSCGFKFVANTAPIVNNQIESFEEMANASTGVNYLGILRMDMDNLGTTFALGLRDERSISRVTTLSRTIDFFFSGYVDKICKEFRHIYVTYTGGDDVFILGAWNEIIEVARKINEKFTLYTCENPDLSISAGIFLCKGKFPIGRAALLTGEKLKQAKVFNQRRKNAVTLFNHSISWEKLNKIVENGEWIISKLGKNAGISRSLIYRISQLYKQYSSEDKIHLYWVPKFFYMLARNIKSNELRAQLQSVIPSLGDELPVWASYVALKTRNLVKK